MTHESLKNEDLRDAYFEEVQKIVDGALSELQTGDLKSSNAAYMRVLECAEASEWTSSENNENLAIQVLLWSPNANTVLTDNAIVAEALSKLSLERGSPFVFCWFAKEAMYYDCANLLLKGIQHAENAEPDLS